MIRWSVMLLLAAVLAAGCSNAATDQASTDGSSETERPASQDPPAVDPRDTPSTTPNSLAGNWYLVVSRSLQSRQPRMDIYSAVIKVTGKGDELGGKLLESLGGTDGAELSDPKFTEQTADFRMSLFETPVRFTGRLRNGVVWGNLLDEERQTVEPARLERAGDETLEKFDQPQQPAGFAALQALTPNADPFETLQTFLKDHASSPLAIDGALQMLVLSKGKGLDAKQVEDTVEKYLEVAGNWGPRMVQFARLNSAFVLAGLRHHPELSQKYLDAFEQNLTKESPTGWERLLKMGRRIADVAVALPKIKSEDADEREQARAELKRLLAQNVFNHMILFALAEDAESRDDVDEALERYAQLAALPHLAMLVQRELAEDGEPGPDASERLEKLWNEKHGSDDGLDEFLTDVYRRTIYSFASPETQPTPADAGNRVVLCELFTGSRCPPCVAADVAVGGLETAFGKQDLIVLRYHQHIPGPDPLANQQTEVRMGFYRDGPVMGTPSTYVNGTKIEGVLGPFLDRFVDQSYERLLDAVDPLLEQNTELKINLSAESKGGELAISANVEGLESPSETLRLRLVLAEDEVEYAAPNQIRLHEMVVRSMPGGPNGVEPQDGKLEYSETVQLAEFRQRLVDDMAALEENVGEEFDVDLEPEKLHLVAFVQDNETREVLQAAAVPVRGTLEYGQTTTEEKPRSTSDTDDEPAKASTPGSSGPELKAPQSKTDEADSN